MGSTLLLFSLQKAGLLLVAGWKHSFPSHKCSLFLRLTKVLNKNCFLCAISVTWPLAKVHTLLLELAPKCNPKKSLSRCFIRTRHGCWERHTAHFQISDYRAGLLKLIASVPWKSATVALSLLPKRLRVVPWKSLREPPSLDFRELHWTPTRKPS